MPPTVLVVDDDIGFRRLVTRLLRARGFDVVAEACDGAEALTAVRVHCRPGSPLLIGRSGPATVPDAGVWTQAMITVGRRAGRPLPCWAVGRGPDHDR